jgi:hypothetical protein
MWHSLEIDEMWISGVELLRIRTIVFAGLAIDSLFLIFACRNLKKNIWQFNPFSNMYVNFSALFGFFDAGGGYLFSFFAGDSKDGRARLAGIGFNL